MMRREDAHLLMCVEGPYHTSIQKSQEEYFAIKREEDQRMLEKKFRDYFKNEWVLAKEREIREYQKQEDAAKDDDVKPALQYMISVTSDALRLNFSKMMSVELVNSLCSSAEKWQSRWSGCRRNKHNLLTTCGIPFRADEESDEEEMFVT